MKIAPSIIAGDFTRFPEEIKLVEDAGADILHLDVMDGVFVPNLTFGPMVVKAINQVTEMILDVHLMIVKPENYLGQYIEAGADWLSFHKEATQKTDECIKLIKSQGCKAGLALNPPTPFEFIQEYLEQLDFVLIMTVNPGFYGQKFMTEVVGKIEKVKNWLIKKNLTCLIQVDGGINSETVKTVCDAGADIVVAGAGIFKTDNYKKAIRDLRCLKD